jgi:hypothetical protein
VKSKSFAQAGGVATLVSEATWFWHPGERVIKGYATAIEMPVAMFDYTSRFEDGNLVSDLTAYAPDGTGQEDLETFEFTGPDTYVWTLFSKEGGALNETMGGTFTRSRR